MRVGCNLDAVDVVHFLSMCIQITKKGGKSGIDSLPSVNISNVKPNTPTVLTDTVSIYYMTVGLCSMAQAVCRSFTTFFECDVQNISIHMSVLRLLHKSIWLISSDLALLSRVISITWSMSLGLQFTVSVNRKFCVSSEKHGIQHDKGWSPYAGQRRPS